MNKSKFVLCYINKTYDIYFQKNKERRDFYIQVNEKFITLSEYICSEENYSFYRIKYLSKPTEHTINDFMTMYKYFDFYISSNLYPSKLSFFYDKQLNNHTKNRLIFQTLLILDLFEILKGIKTVYEFQSFNKQKKLNPIRVGNKLIINIYENYIIFNIDNNNNFGTLSLFNEKEINNKNDLLKFLNISNKYNELSYDDCDKIKEILKGFVHYKHVYSSGFCFEIKINDKKYRFRKYKNEDLYIEEYDPILKQFK